MTKLSNTHRTLLTLAAESDDGAVAAPEDLKSFTLLIQRGHLISLPQSDGPSQLLITDAGRAAIDLPAAPAAIIREPAVIPATKEPKGKIGLLVGLLSRPEGAGIDQMMTVTGWQAHSVRGAMSGSIKKALGMNVVSEKTDAGRTYRIDPPVGA